MKRAFNSANAYVRKGPADWMAAWGYVRNSYVAGRRFRTVRRILALSGINSANTRVRLLVRAKEINASLD